MKRIIAFLLCMGLVMLVTTSLAETRMCFGVIQEVMEYGDIVLEIPFVGLVTVNMAGDTKVDLQEPPAPGLIAEVYYDQKDGQEAFPESVLAKSVLNGICDGFVTEVDAENAKVKVVSPLYGHVWVFLPKTSDFDELQGKSIRCRPYPRVGQSINEAVDTMDYEILQSFSGKIIKIDGNALTLDVDGATVLATIGEDTRVPFPLIEGQIADVFLKPVEGGGVPEAVAPLSIHTGNG